jgi:hypothetical protein
VKSIYVIEHKVWGRRWESLSHFDSRGHALERMRVLGVKGLRVVRYVRAEVLDVGVEPVGAARVVEREWEDLRGSLRVDDD